MKKPILILLIISTIFLFYACSTENNTNEKIQESIYTSENTISDTGEAEKSSDLITIKIGNSSFTARLYDNETAKAFSDMLPLTLDMNELHGNE
ncbi:MAG: hypothetical protein K2J59_02790, partial [Eubacterium sp.]|nr:hypothetical protein [Eubacterium sp.]